MLGSTEYNYADRKRDTCNLFVGDMIESGGTDRPQTPTAEGKMHDPSAGEWGTRDGNNGKTLIPGWRSLGPGESPQPGDVAAYKFAQQTPGGDTGHSGIVGKVVNGIAYVVASNTKSVCYNKFLSSGDSAIVYHRYIGN
jgi:hypothetical protein